MNCVSWQDSWGYTQSMPTLTVPSSGLSWNMFVTIENACEVNFAQQGLLYFLGWCTINICLSNGQVKDTLYWNTAEETFAFSEMLGSVTWWTALVSSLTLANSSSYRQTSRRRTSPSHPQCRPLSAPARLRCVAYSCTRPGTCHWKTRVVKMNSTVLKTIWKMFIRSRRHKANQGDVNKDDLRVSSTLEGILH